jgi:FtsZ-binding cell division protein ZapB
MIDYCLEFKAKFSDDETEQVAKIAAILADTKMQLLQVEVERLRAELQQAREEIAMLKTSREIWRDNAEKLLAKMQAEKGNPPEQEATE